MTKNYIEEIEKYDNDALTDAELQDFQFRLEKDAELQQQLKSFKQAKELSTIHGVIEFKKKFQEIEDKIDNRIKLKNIIIVFAGVLLIALLIYFLFPSYFANQKNEDPVIDSNLFVSYYEKYRDPNVSRSKIDDKMTIKASEAYRNNQYETSSDLFGQLCSTEGRIDACFYASLSLLNAKNMDITQAISFSNQIPSSSPYRSILDWYLALGYIKLKQYSFALPLLESLALQKKYKSKESKALLNILKEK